MLGDCKCFGELSRLDNVPAEQETLSMTPSLIFWARSNLALNSYSTLLSLFFYDLSLFPHVIHSHTSHYKSAVMQYYCKSLVNACVFQLMWAPTTVAEMALCSPSSWRMKEETPWFKGDLGNLERCILFRCKRISREDQEKFEENGPRDYHTKGRKPDEDKYHMISIIHWI